MLFTLEQVVTRRAHKEKLLGARSWLNEYVQFMKIHTVHLRFVHFNVCMLHFKIKVQKNF